MRLAKLALTAAVLVSAGSLALGGDLDDVKKKGAFVALTSPGGFPFQLDEKSQNPAGLDGEIALAIASRAGVRDVHWKSVPFETLIDKLAAGDADLALAGISITEERRKKVDFSRPYAEVGKAVLLPVGRAEAPAALVTAAGTTSVDASKLAYPAATLRTLPSEDEAAKEVLEGRADGMVFDAPFLREFAKRHEGKVVAKDLPDLPRESIGVAVRKGRPEILAVVDEAIAGLEKDGKLAKLRRKYHIEKD